MLHRPDGLRPRDAGHGDRAGGDLRPRRHDPRAKDLDEAIALANSGRFGNASSIYTTSGKAARAYKYRVRGGNIGVNLGVAAPMAYFPSAAGRFVLRRPAWAGARWRGLLHRSQGRDLAVG